MIILEFFTIIAAFILEGINMQTGSIKVLTNWLTKDRTASLFKLRLFIGFVVWTGSLLYIVFAISWCFSASLPIQVAGLVLLVLSCISYFGFKFRGKEKPVWVAQLDSMLSMSCIVIVAIARIRGA